MTGPISEAAKAARTTPEQLAALARFERELERLRRLVNTGRR